MQEKVDIQLSSSSSKAPECERKRRATEVTPRLEDTSENATRGKKFCMQRGTYWRAVRRMARRA